MNEQKQISRKKALILIISIGLLSFIGGYFLSDRGYLNDDSISDSSLTNGDEIDSNCNVLGINLHGTLVTYIPPNNDSSPVSDTDMVSSESIIYHINQAKENENIRAILVEVDSFGGLPVAGEEIANALKASPKPTAAVIRQTGTSAAYWAISSAGRIFASRNSDVGSIGVTISYLDNVSKNQKEGYSFNQLSAGKYKDMGSPDKALTEEEKALYIKDLNVVQQNFIDDVSVNRGIPVEDVKKIADGTSVLGEKAKALHLIDEIGSLPETEKYLSEKIGEEVVTCWY